MDTPMQAKMREHTHSDLEIDFMDYIKNPRAKVMTRDQVRDDLIRLSTSEDALERIPTDAQMNALMQNYCDGPKRITINNKQKRLWVMGKTLELSDNEIKREYEKAVALGHDAKAAG